jgi:hypothetical protein
VHQQQEITMNALEIYSSLGCSVTEKIVYESEYGECFDNHYEALLFNLIVRARNQDIELSEVAEALRMICANNM